MEIIYSFFFMVKDLCSSTGTGDVMQPKASNNNMKE